MIFAKQTMLTRKQRITLGMSALVLSCSIAYTALSAAAVESADTLASGTLEYMDPFDLTITRYTFNPISTPANPGPVPSPVTVPGNIGNLINPVTPATVAVPYYFLRPLVRVPYKPEFRSPYKP
jgi:hypothetical protein